MKHQTAFRYVAFGAAVLIPTLVIAQQQRTPPGGNVFVAGRVLTATDVEQMRLALVDVIARVNTLQSNSGSITKADARTANSTYPIVASSAPVAQNDVGLAQVSCLGVNDILLACGCRGTENGSNSQQLNMKRQTATNPVGSPSTCTCQSANVGSNVARVVEASGTCLTVP
jgi:hypothetical protein